MINLLQDRTYLHDRHRLSHQQIDRWLGENRSKEFMHEKLKRLEAVKHFLFVTDLFTQNKISFTSLKGPLLSYRIYRDPAVRISHDIDILIEITAIVPVMKILIENGFHLTEGSVWPQKKAQQELVTSAIHHLSFYNNEFECCVEVHWILMQELPVSLKRQREIIAANLTEIDFAGRKFTVLTKEFELLFLLIHGARHGWSRLKWLIDINEYPMAEMNYSKFEQLVKQLNAGRIIGQTNYLLGKFFNSSLPLKGDDRLAENFTRYALQSIDGELKVKLSTREMIGNYRYLWLMFPGFYYKFRLVTGSLFRPNDTQVIDSSFKVIYYLYRPYSFIKRRILHA